MNDTWMLKNRERLLYDLNREVARLLKQNPLVKIALVDCILRCPDGDEYVFSFEKVLDALVNDLYWDDRGNWADAHMLQLKEM